MEKTLQAAGLTKNEAKIYVAIARLGRTALGEVAKKTKIHRTNVYDAIKSLLNKGLVGFITIDKTKHYQITNPNNLLLMLKEKEELLLGVIPQLSGLRNQQKEENNAQILEGLAAARRAMDGFLDYNKEILVMGVSTEAAKLIKPFLTNFHKRRIQKKIVMKHIYNTDATQRMKELAKMEYTKVRILPEKFDTPVATNIVGDELTLIHWNKNPVITRIKNKILADVYRKYFYALWNQARAPPEE